MPTMSLPLAAAQVTCRQLARGHTSCAAACLTVHPPYTVGSRQNAARHDGGRIPTLLFRFRRDTRGPGVDVGSGSRRSNGLCGSVMLTSEDAARLRSRTRRNRNARVLFVRSGLSCADPARPRAAVSHRRQRHDRGTSETCPTPTKTVSPASTVWQPETDHVLREGI